MIFFSSKLRIIKLLDVGANLIFQNILASSNAYVQKLAKEINTCQQIYGIVRKMREEGAFVLNIV